VNFRVVGRETLAAGTMVALEEVDLETPDGHTVRRDVVRHPGGVAVVAVDRRRRVWFVRQYRVAVNAPILEIPAGTLDRPGEDPVDAVRRELGEELGATAGTITKLGTMLPSPGYTDEHIGLYLADGIVGGERAPDGAEEHHAELVALDVDEVFRMLDEGAFADGKTQLALALWARRTG
jgi:8-oxo-dGTP pyrophosphatase MutT (NUDIX family)